MDLCCGHLPLAAAAAGCRFSDLSAFPGGWCDWVTRDDIHTRPVYNLYRQYVFRGISWKITPTFGLSFRYFGEDGKVHFQGQGKTLVKQRL